MKITGIILISFFILPGISYSQEPRTYGSFSNSATRRTEKKILKSARKQYDFGNYEQALTKYSELLKLDSTNSMYNFELAQTLYDNFRQIESARYFERAIKYSKDTLGDAYYFLASAYHLAGKFDQAQVKYTKYLELLRKYGTSLSYEEENNLKKDIVHRIQMCENGKVLSKSPIDKIHVNGQYRSFQIINVGLSVNSDYDDYDAVLSPNDSIFYFTTRRDSTTGAKVDWDDKFFEDIYVSTKEQNGWSKAKNLGDPINTDKHEAIIGVSPDGKTLYFYKGIKQGTFYYTSLDGGTWKKPEELYEKSDINTKAWESSFFGFTLTGSDLYVVSDRSGETAMGGRDIYISKKQADGSWSQLSNLGSLINTEYDEDAPFITADGKTMFFSSQGHNSMGGFDIFRSDKAGDSWSQPVNIGIPINTPGDDIYFTLANRSNRAYYSSSGQAKDGTSDMDIYMIDMCDEIPMATIAGFAKGISSGTMMVVDKESGKEIGKYEIRNGKYSVTIDHGKKYIFTVKSSVIEPASTEVYVPRHCKSFEMYQELDFSQPGQPLVFRNAFFDIKSEAGKMSYSDFLSTTDKGKLLNYSETSVATSPVLVVSVDTFKTISGKDTATAIKTTFSFNNILFEYGKWNLSKSFLPQLDKAVAMLKKDYSKVNFEVAGHTDSKGLDDYNLSLSQRRAESVANYLASRGISRSRMKVTGYGETKPIAPNENPDGSDNPDGRTKNRRTEIVIIR